MMVQVAEVLWTLTCHGGLCPLYDWARRATQQGLARAVWEGLRTFRIPVWSYDYDLVQQLIAATKSTNGLERNNCRWPVSHRGSRGHGAEGAALYLLRGCCPVVIARMVI